MNRKDFFRQVGRLTLLGGITGISGYLILNEKVSASCTESSICKDCSKITKCDLPKAIEEKHGK